MEPKEDDQKKVLENTYKGKLMGMRLRRMGKVQRESLLEKQCKKAGIDPEQIKNMVKK